MCKKILAVLLLTLFLLGAAKSCGSDTKKPTPTTTTTTIPEDSDGDFEFDMGTYRIVYEQMPVYYGEMVGEDTYFKWRDTVDLLDESEMHMVKFIKHFNITRAQFDKATEEYLNSMKADGDDLTSELNELPNADLIYTFNNAKISDYYIRDPKKNAEAEKWLEEWLKTHKPYNSYAEYQKANSK